jgi:aspartate racemase
VQLIGLLGGMSWESTAEYYRLANEIVRDRCGGLHSARCLTYSVDFAPIERMQAAGSWDEAAGALVRAAQALEGAGADFLVLCTNTMHLVADTVAGAVDIPLLHIGDTTAAAVTGAGVRRVGLLGTGFTMSQPFYADRLAESGLEVLLPSPKDRDVVHRIIYDELCLGVIREESREEYRRVIRGLVEAGAEGVIYGCTEIELLVGQQDSPVPVFPTTRLHVEAAVERALAGRPRRPDLP